MSACSNLSSNAGTPMKIEFSQPDKPVRISKGQEFAIRLVSNPTTGYGWQLTGINDNVVLVTNVYVADKAAEDVVGSGGHERWTFRATGKGESEITMEYRRPWETDIPPIQTNVFTVIVE